MAFSTAMKHWLLPLALSFIFISHFRLGLADDYDQPHTGAAGVLENEYLPSNGGPNNNNNGYSSENGGSYNHEDPDYIVYKALLCFEDKNVYSSCEEAYRLTETGELHVPPGYTDQFCNGACEKETNLILNCIEGVLTHFEFYNKATINDVRLTVKEGCSYGSKRGNFNVAEHVQAEESNAFQASKALLHGLGLMILVLCFLL